jgi:pimeloyl-ACP methyl ester carboxylesterase
VGGSLHRNMDTITVAHQPAVPVYDAVDDWRGMGDLIELATQRLSAPAEEVHQAIADGWFRVAGRSGSPAHTAHRNVTANLYGSIRMVGSVARTSLDIGATTIGKHRHVRTLWDSRIGAGVRAAANALWGDEFERRSSPMHTELSIYDANGTPVTADRAALTSAFEKPTPRLAVLLHGLGKTERCWNTKAADEGNIAGLPKILEADGFTPILVRYNSGRRVSDNGEALAALLEETTTNWPTAVDEIVLIGHSMGGLIARSSLYSARSADHDWINYVNHLVALATPHFGSPIEKGAHVASQLLTTTAVTRSLGVFINGRSAGIKDMRHGSIHPTDHSEHPESSEGGRVVVAPPIKGIRQHHAVGVVTDSNSHPLGILFGDLVVRVNSATGVSSTGRVASANVRVFGGLDHLGLLHDASVHNQIREWLTPVASRPTEATS